MIKLFRKLTDRLRSNDRLYAMKRFYVEYVITYKDDVAHYFAIEIFATSEADARRRLESDFKVNIHKIKESANGSSL